MDSDYNEARPKRWEFEGLGVSLAKARTLMTRHYTETSSRLSHGRFVGWRPSLLGLEALDDCFQLFQLSVFVFLLEVKTSSLRLVHLQPKS